MKIDINLIGKKKVWFEKRTEAMKIDMNLFFQKKFNNQMLMQNNFCCTVRIW